MKLCEEYFIPCDSIYYNDCVQSEQAVMNQPSMKLDKGKAPMYLIIEEEEPEEESI